ncbi:MAG: helicase-exonuclease AddAB subunit AddB [Bacillota bacterium]|nr:helicase-exonuclease AddAB subunit AddB [Bacillota bacterium]
MSLRLVYGRAGTGKSHFCLNEIGNRINNTKSQLILIVPEQYTLQAERNLLRFVGNAGTLHAEVLSFRRLAYRVFNETGGLTRRHINSAGKAMLIYRSVEEAKDKLKVFSKAAKQKGFINTLSDLIGELKRYNVTPEKLGDTATELSDQYLKIKLNEISLIYSSFEEKLGDRYMDSDDDLTQLADRLSGSDMLEDAEIWIDEFSGFTPQEYRVIMELLKKVGRVTVCLCTDCILQEKVLDSDIFMPAVKTAGKLLKIAESQGIVIDREKLLEENYRFIESEELLHLEKHFFSHPFVPYHKKTSDISLFASVNIFAEVEETAKDIITICRDKKLRYGQIAVVSRNLEAYDRIIRAVFNEYGIPFFIDSKRSLDSHPLVRLIQSVLEIHISNWAYEPVFRYIKTGLLSICLEDSDLLENYVLANGIRGSRWLQTGDWNYRMGQDLNEHQPSDYELDVLKKVNEVRRTVTNPLSVFFTRIKGRKKAREQCTALFDFLCDIGVPERIETIIKDFRAEGNYEEANEYSQVWNILIEVLDQVVEVMGDDSLNIERFRDVLSTGFGEYSIGLIPPALDQIQVGSMERSKNHEIKALYILGANDGILPAVSNNEGVLSDRDREKLYSEGLELAQDTRTKTFEEQFLIYTAFATPSKSLRLSYPIADHEGRSLRPSIILSRLKRIFPALNEYSNLISYEDEEGYKNLTSPGPVLNELLSELRRSADGYETASYWKYVYDWFAEKDQWRDKLNTSLNGLNYTNQSARINSEKIRRLYGENLYSSVSRIESYAACPFSYFLKYGLMAGERRIFKISAPDIGTFMHTIIDRFSSQIEEDCIGWRGLDMETCTKEISKLVDELLNSLPDYILNTSARYRYLASKLKRILTRTVWVISEHIRKGSFEPLGYEIAFGRNGKLPPVEIELDSGEKLTLTGRIDRIDTLDTEKNLYFRIIDYKSGMKDFKLSDVYNGLQMQLVTYLEAVFSGMEIQGGKPVLPGGILYFRIDDPIVRANCAIDDMEIERQLMKKLRMKGLVLADAKLVRDMDSEINGESLVIPARMNTGEVLGKSSAATAEQFSLLRKHVRKLLAGIVKEMMGGNVEIKPYRKKNETPCSYCSYTSVCQFDPSLKDNKYKVMNDLKDENVWESMRNS